MTVAVNSSADESSSSGDDSGCAGGPAVTSRYRRVLPQIMACMAINLLEFGLGLGVGFTAVVIPVLTGLQTDRYPHETIRFTAEQASWYGSMIYLTEPLGSILSGWINEQIGRKRAIQLACIPHMTAWLLLYTAQSAEQVFAAGILLGLGAGLMVPVFTFVSEVSQASIRGMMLILSTMSMMFGIFAMFSLGTWMTWRDSAMVGFAMPLAAACAIFFVPETPHWLLSRDRIDDARKSLLWLRGWLPSGEVKQVETELTELIGYIEVANACGECQRVEPVGKCTHKSSYREKVRDLLRMKTLRPFSLLLFSFFVIHSSGNMAIRPFLVQIFATFGFPLDANWGLVVFGLIDILSNVFCVFAIPWLGKRPLFFCGLFTVAASCFAIGANAFFTFPITTSSFDPASAIGVGDNYVAMVFFITLAIGASISGCVPWMMNSEIFPFKIRGTATGITSACSYIGIFIATKTYINIERGLSIGGGFILYGGITTVGLLILYQVLPETEGRTLGEIEAFFSDKTRKLTDRHIKSIDSKPADVDDAVKSSKSMDNPAFVEGA